MVEYKGSEKYIEFTKKPITKPMNSTMLIFIILFIFIPSNIKASF